MDGEFGFDLPFEEGVVELLVVDVDLSHLGTNLLPHFGFHRFGVLLETEKVQNDQDGSHGSLFLLVKENTLRYYVTILRYYVSILRF